MLKKILLVCFAILGLVKCTSTPITKIIPKVTVLNLKEISLARVTIKRAGEMKITLNIKNLTNDNLEIVWKESSINNSLPFITKQKYNEATTPMPNTILSPFSNFVVDVLPSSNVYFGNYWRQLYLEYPVDIVLKLKQGTKEEFVILKIDVIITEN
ncbi:hypothetical protein H3N56_11470 [Cetobacterium sp. 2A]|uniref:hypothetical protein n=1 Tax=Cetobacterium sp. 2A TaxID=2754723 RepID=UPI00163C3262|nr:hypothetical protein [Cetobacterium sp. 2A]MBC2857051.1 hypothetical protein [Cetobacterium sp. 2A]